MMEKSLNGGGRLASLDILRGFDMLWIIGGADLLCAVCGLFPGGADCGLVRQMRHVAWDGLNFMDLIFPVFIFIAGISFPFSHAKRVANGETSARTHLSILRRMLLLLALGVLYNGFFASDWTKLADFRYFSVLGKIGIAWGVAALVYVHFGLKARVAIAFAGLAAYAALLFCTAPDAPAGAGSFSLEGCFVGWLDRRFTPGHLYCGNIMEPSGPFVSFFGFPTALFGMCAGDLVRSSRFAAVRKVLLLALCGLAGLALGYGLSPGLPIVKKLWTPTFTLVAAGYGFLAFSFSYLVVDVLGWKGWCGFLRLIGVNALTIYIASQIVNFVAISDFFIAGLAALTGPFALTIRCAGALGVRLGFLAFLDRHKVYLKV